MKKNKVIIVLVVIIAGISLYVYFGSTLLSQWIDRGVEKTPGLVTVNKDELIEKRQPTIVNIDEDERKRIIKICKNEYDKLKIQKWNTEEKSASKNGNTLILDNVLNLMKEKRPLPTYANLDPDQVIKDLKDYYGDSIYYNGVECMEVTVNKSDSELSKSINNGKECISIKLMTSFNKPILLYLVDKGNYSDFYEVGRKVNSVGWPVGISDFGELVLSNTGPV